MSRTTSSRSATSSRSGRKSTRPAGRCAFTFSHHAIWITYRAAHPCHYTVDVPGHALCRSFIGSALRAWCPARCWPQQGDSTEGFSCKSWHKMCSSHESRFIVSHQCFVRRSTRTARRHSCTRSTTRKWRASSAAKLPSACSSTAAAASGAPYSRPASCLWVRL